MLVICGYTCWVYFSSDPLGIFFRALGIQYSFPPSIQPSKTLKPQNICTVPTENKYMRGRRGFADSIDLQSSSNDYELNSLTRIKRGKINIPNSPNYLKDLNTNVLILPHMVLLAVMLLINFFYSHVQIIARLFSFMPCVYWCMALIYQSLDTSQKWYSGYLKRSILIYCLVQVVVGSILFMNHMPPA